MSEISWIKLSTNMFEDDKIDFIESLPDADTILVIWAKLLTLAGKCNCNGFVMLTENIPYDERMLAHKFRRNINTVAMALDTFIKLEMVSISDRGYHISNWDKHQNISGMEKVKEQTRLRVARHRDNLKQLMSKAGSLKDISANECNGNCNVTVTDEEITCNVTCNADVTSSNATELDLDKELDQEQDHVVVVVDLASKNIEQEIKTKSDDNNDITPEKFYSENIGLITPIVAEKIEHWIRDGIDPGLIVELMKIAVFAGARNWSYIDASIRNNFNKNIKSLSQFRSSELERHKRKRIDLYARGKPQYDNFDQREYIANDLEKYYANTNAGKKNNA